MKRDTLQENTVTIDLVTKQQTNGRLNLSQKQIRKSGTILANILLDYVKNGGEIDKLTPDLFSKQEE